MRPILVALCLSSALIFSSGCKRNSAASNEIIVGEYGSMTGDTATFGVSTDNGVQLAVKLRNAAGGVNGKQIKLKLYDDQGKTDKASSDVTRLIQNDQVVAVLGEVASSRSMAGGQICQKLAVPMITPSSTNPDVTAIGDMISRVCYIDSFQGQACADFILNNLKLKTVAIFYNDGDDYSNGLKKFFTEAFEKGGGKVVAVAAFKKGDTEFASQLTTIAAAKPDAVFAPVYYGDIVAFARQARDRGIKVPLVGADGWVSDTLKNAGDALDGCYFTDHYAKEDNSPEVSTFLKEYRAAYHAEPDSMAALGYDAANLLFDAMTRAKSMSGPDLAAAINATKDFKAVTGTITIDADRNARKGLVIQVLKGGTYKLFQKIPAPK